MGERRQRARVRGRVEAALEQDLIERQDVGKGERTALRAQARAVDVAEAMSDPHLVSEANRVYLDLRTAAGLTAGGYKPVDAFDDIMARLAAPSPGDTPNR